MEKTNFEYKIIRVTIKGFEISVPNPFIQFFLNFWFDSTMRKQAKNGQVFPNVKNR